MLVTLRRAQVSFFEGFGLTGFLEVEEDGGKSKMYSFRLPTADDPNPPGWSCIERLTQVTSEAVRGGWDETGTSNPVAQAAVVELSTRYAGERFVVTETAQPGGSPTVDLLPLDTSIAAPRKLNITPGVAVSVPPRYTTCFHISVTTEVGQPALLVLHITDVPEALWPRFKVPDKNDRTPDDWWFVETFTGVAHERVAAGWDPLKPGNPVLDDAIKLLAEAIEEHNHVPLFPNSVVDVARWRREMIRVRLGFRPKKKPFIFLGRPDHNVEHTRAIVYDAAGDYLFCAHVEPGKALGMPAMVMDAGGKAMLAHLDNIDTLRGILNRYIRFARTGRPPKPANPPKELLLDLLTFPDRAWPIIKGIVRIPTVREDGTIITKAGYDEQSQLWYAPEFELEPVPEHPTHDDVQRARALLLTPIAQFPFVDEGSRTAALASLFEQVVRPMIRGPRPLYIFDAPEQGQGTGKTLLAKIFQVIITGAEPTTTALGKREEEIEKRVTSFLRAGDPYIILDNLVREVVSEALQQLATSERWQARLLNTNDAPIYTNNATVVMTLNGARCNKDILRRTVFVRLDAKMANAFERTDFKIEDIIGWVRDRRAAIIRAVLVLVRSWVAAGRPVDKEVVRGSFESWCRVIGGIMKHSGFVGLGQALRATNERDVNAEDHRLLIASWLAEVPLGQPMPAITLGQLALRVGLYDGRLPKRGTPLSIGKAMASVLKTSLVGQVIDGYTIEISPTRHNGYTTYILRPLQQAPSSIN